MSAVSEHQTLATTKRTPKAISASFHRERAGAILLTVPSRHIDEMISLAASAIIEDQAEADQAHHAGLAAAL